MFYTYLFLLALGAMCWSCGEDQVELSDSARIGFTSPQRVIIQGYSDHVMEPFLSRDGRLLFFNNRNAPTDNTNLHWATKLTDTLFQYEGELMGVNTPSLEGVPTMDRNGNFYYVHTGTYEQTQSTIYRADYSNGGLSNNGLVERISRKTMGWVNFDVEVSDDGQTLYFVDGRFDARGGPYAANLVIATKQANQFARLAESDRMLQHINTSDLEYAAAISKDELQLSFTRVAAPLTEQSQPVIYLATRNHLDEPFTNVQPIAGISGFVEAATFSADDRGMYYHKKDEGIFRLYYIRKQ